MAPKKASAEWTGVISIAIGEEIFSLDSRLFSFKGRPTPLPMKYVHSECKGLVREKDPGDQTDADKKGEDKTAVETRFQGFCPRCNRYLKSDEIGRGIETPAGIINITEEDAEILKFPSVKKIKAELVESSDPSIEAIGVDRRFLLLPKAQDTNLFLKLIYVLEKSGAVGFIPTIVIKGKPRVAILRPLTFPKVIFGESRRVLVVDTLNDTGCLKDPAGFLDYPQGDVSTAIKETSPLVTMASRAAGKLDPERCIDPRRQMAKLVAKKALERSLPR